MRRRAEGFILLWEEMFKVLYIQNHILKFMSAFRRLLDCENHICERVCHEGPCESCALLPDHVTHCPCGSTPLMELLISQRTSCLDPIPTCTSLCGKLLPCSTPGTILICACLQMYCTSY